MAIKPIPEGYHTVTPWIIVRGAAGLIEFLKDAFGAEELGRFYDEDGSIGHAEVRIGDSIVMLFDAQENWPSTAAFLRLFVDDGDAVFQRAMEAGAVAVTEMTELAFGDRVGRVRDPAGNVWWIQTRIEDVSPDDVERRMAEPTYQDAMRYVQQTLQSELSGRNRP